MAGTRALFASIGASVALVAAAALSLLAVSAIFAFGGWSDSVSPSAGQTALVLTGAPGADGDAVAASNGSRAIVAPPPAPAPVRSAERRAEPVASSAPRPAQPRPAAVSPRRAEGRVEPIVLPEQPRPTQQPAAAKSGDRVRKVGETLSAGVSETGTALANATQPLLPPVSVAVQQVLNLVAEVVRRTANGLATTLDTLLPPKQ